MGILYRFLCIVIGYIFGLFQTGYIYGKMHGVDIRQSGSGNAGATNANRVLGKKAGIITYFGDAIKAVLATLLVRLLFKDTFHDNMTILLLYAGLGVVLGHNYPFYLQFKGGKGIAATSGVICALNCWPLTFIAFFTFMSVTITSRYVSLGSLVLMTGFLIEFICFALNGLIPLLTQECYAEAIILATIFTLFAFFRHKENIKRLIAGNERKIFAKKKEN